MDRCLVAVTLLVMYDVVRDQRRAKLAAYLQQWGDRLQYSVFLCRLPEAGIDEFVADASRILDKDEDSLLLVRMCKLCYEGVMPVGQGEIEEPPLYRAVF